jgi:hypothetical protein
MALAPQDVCGAAAWGPQPTAMQTEHVARGGRHWACSIAEKKLEKAAPRAGVSLDNWGLLCGRACQVFFIVFLPCCSNGSSEIPALWLTTCAGGSMVRGARWLRTTFYPWRAISPAHPILQALSAPVKPWGWGPPPHNRFALRTRAPQRVPYTSSRSSPLCDRPGYPRGGAQRPAQS